MTHYTLVSIRLEDRDLNGYATPFVYSRLSAEERQLFDTHLDKVVGFVELAVQRRLQEEI